MKQAIDVSFAKGLDTKTDPKRVEMGSFLSLRNTVFDKGGLLQKRNGYGDLPALPDTSYTYLTTLKDNLTAVGQNIAALNAGGSSWVTKGSIQPLSLDTLALIRNNFNQTACDAAVAPNGLVCTVYLESTGGATTNKYAIADSVTGQNIVAPTVIPVASGTVSGGMRVFVVGNNFIIVFTNTIAAVAHLQYVAISTANPTTVGANTDIAASYIAATTLAWDGFVANDRLYLAYNTTSGGQAVKVTYLTRGLTLVTATTFSGYKATMMSVTADLTNATSPIIWVTFYRSDTSLGFMASVDSNLHLLMNPVEIIAAETALNLTSAAQGGTCTMFYEIANNYSYDAAIPSHKITALSVTPGAAFSSVFGNAVGSITASSATGLVNGMYVVDNTTAGNIVAGTTFTVSGTTLTLSAATGGASASSPGDAMVAATVSAHSSIRSVGLASKAFIVDGVIYYLAAFQSPYQPTYFLINGSTSTAASPVIAAKLAYENGGGYITLGLPGVTVDGARAQVPYLFKDLIQAVNKNTNVPSGSQTAGIYSQTGVNLASFTLGTDALDTAEIGGDLHISGGFLWLYDGYLPVEHNFLVWPDSVEVTTATGAGNLTAQDYYYQAVYEWTDNQGNAYRSAPSIPVKQTTTTASSTNTVNVPTLRLTMKTANPVKIVLYRWSTAQQSYYQVTSITTPTQNSTTSDSVAIVDTFADSTILGNNLIYTTGGVVEDVNAPASDIMTLFDTRLWLVDAEDRNLLWYSKQVIEATPVEMSDLFTVFVPPTTGTAASTGPVKSLAVMDDKLIIGKKNAFLYINGTGPDNTGAMSQYSQPIFITATVGCDNQRSLILTPNGLMFQSDKGIWILGRDLQTNYIGAPVQDLTLGATVTSAVAVPETNQVRFTLDSGITLMYDYFYGQWGGFSNVPALSSCIYSGLHTYINDAGKVRQETPGIYLDGSVPVLMQFTTGPLRLGALQGYQRAFFFYLMGEFFSPHKLYVSIAYDYSTTPSHSVVLVPPNYSTPYGSGVSQTPYGQGNPYGGGDKLEEFRVFLKTQRCQAFSISLQEIYDGTYDVPAGAGLTLSGINLVLGMKSPFKPMPAARSYG